MTPTQRRAIAAPLAMIMIQNEFSTPRNGVNSPLQRDPAADYAVKSWLAIFRTMGFTPEEIAEAMNDALSHWNDCGCFTLSPTIDRVGSTIDRGSASWLERERYQVYPSDLIHIMESNRIYNTWHCERWEIVVKDPQHYSNAAISYLVDGPKSLAFVPQSRAV